MAFSYWLEPSAGLVKSGDALKSEYGSCLRKTSWSRWTTGKLARRQGHGQVDCGDDEAISPLRKSSM
jgi:hypothetical protein